MFEFYKMLNIKKYQVYKVNLSLDVLKVGIQFSNFEKFEKFVNEQNINAVFFSEYYDKYENYIITEENLEKFNLDLETIKVIENDIKQYNSKISKIDFSKVFAVIIACIYNGQYCYVYLEDDKNFDENILIDPDEKLNEILKDNMFVIKKTKTEKNKTIENLKSELREKIISDREFSLCTNKELRESYIRKILRELDERYKPLKDIWTREDLNGLYVYREAYNFINSIWNEIKYKK